MIDTAEATDVVDAHPRVAPVFSVRSAESRNGGAFIKGASAEGARLARIARERLR